MKLTSFNYRHRNAFTLAEVLITLGIIGVVAAMTMPTLMNQTNGAQFRTAYKKALSAISQAVTLNVALEEWNFADATATSTGADDLSIYSMLKKRMNVVRTATTTTEAGYTVFPSAIKAKICTQGEGENAKFVPCGSDSTSSEVSVPTPDTFIAFNDGILFAYKNDATNATGCTGSATDGSSNKACLGIIDVNGAKNPNKVVTCKGSNSTNAGEDGNCEVDSPTDIYPVVFYDQTILPASDAARAVLYSK